MLEISQKRLLCDDENVNTFLNVSTLITEYVKPDLNACPTRQISSKGVKRW